MAKDVVVFVDDIPNGVKTISTLVGAASPEHDCDTLPIDLAFFVGIDGREQIPVWKGDSVKIVNKFPERISYYLVVPSNPQIIYSVIRLIFPD